jgi:hypothetical protein
MPFNRLVDLLNTKTLHLARLDKFEDKHEGHIPLSDLSPPPFWDIAAQRHAWAWRFLTFVNCWHAFPEENSLMWSSYAAGDGVVIKSTAGKLADITLGQPNGYTAKVIYGPWPNPIPAGGHLELPLRKRTEFTAESELRIVVEDIDLMILDDFPQLGNLPPSDWRTCIKASFDGLPLIDEIRLRPGSSASFKDDVIEVVSASGIVAPVLESTLASAPTWFDPSA